MFNYVKEFKAFVVSEAKGFPLGAEVDVKCTGSETGRLCQAIHADAAEPTSAENRARRLRLGVRGRWKSNLWDVPSENSKIK